MNCLICGHFKGGECTVDDCDKRKFGKKTRMNSTGKEGK